MEKKCKNENCYNTSVVKGYCVHHYVLLPKCRVSGCGNIKLIRDNLCKKHCNLSVKEIKKEPKKRIKYPKNWTKSTLEQKKLFIHWEKESKLIIYILKKDKDLSVKDACKRRLLELGYDIPEDTTYKCKMSECNSNPNSFNHFSKGFCQRHYQQYLRGIIDFNGDSLRDLVDKDKHNKITSPEKVILSKFNMLVNGIHAIRKELRDIKILSFEMKGKYDFLTQVNYVEESLKFIYSPHFILKTTSFLMNVTLKKILGEEEEPVPVILEVDDKKYKGELIRGEDSNVFITNKVDKKDSVVLFLRGVEDLSDFPFECKAYEKSTNKVQSIRIEEINRNE